MGKLHSWYQEYSTCFILQKASGISVSLSDLSSQGRAVMHCWHCSQEDGCWGQLLTEEKSREKKSKDYRRQVRELAGFLLAGRAFSQEKSLGDVLHHASLPGWTLEQQITSISLFSHSVSSIAPSAPTGNQMGHSLTQRNLLSPSVPGRNKGGSETSRILDRYFAICQKIKAQKLHRTPFDKKVLLSLVIWALSLHCPSGDRCVPVYACKQQRERNICDAHCSIFSSCKHICSLCTQELMLSLNSLPNSLAAPSSEWSYYRTVLFINHVCLSNSLSHVSPSCTLHPPYQSPTGCRRLRHRPRFLYLWDIFWSDFSLRKYFLLGNRNETKPVSFLIPLQRNLLLR